MKIRINDLARELEVKSKAILDVLEEVGITEKKTHSSSVEADEAEKIRKHFSAKSAPASKEKAGPAEIKPKIDLSKISKPGDVLKLLKEREQQQHPAPPAKTAAPSAPPTPAKLPTAEKPAVIAPTAAPPEKTVVVPPRAAKPPVPPAPAPPAAEKPATPPAVVVTPPAPVAKAPAPPPAEAAAPPPPAPPAKPASQQPIVPQRRMITPQTGPRPVYQAPLERTAPRPASGQGATAQAGATTRPQGVVRGQPIFQRPRPTGAAAPGTRPPFGRPGEPRRGPHPTSAPRTGFPPRPGMGGVGPGVPPPGTGRPPGRAGAPPRRPGQRYQQGPKEGPMKGFVPPPRLAISSEPLPITRAITITEGISVKDLAEKLEVRAKDLIARLLMKGVPVTVNQTLDSALAKDLAHHFGAETSVISFEEQTAQEVAQMTGTSQE